MRGGCEGCETDTSLSTIRLAADCVASLCASCVRRVRDVDARPAVTVGRASSEPGARMGCYVAPPRAVDEVRTPDSDAYEKEVDWRNLPEARRRLSMRGWPRRAP